jgi:hypothetical protein
MDLGEIRAYWNSITEAIKPILQRASTIDDPVEWERVVNREVMPLIFGDRARIKLANVLNLPSDFLVGSKIGANFSLDESSGRIRELHNSLIDPEGNLVVPIVFPDKDDVARLPEVIPAAKGYEAPRREDDPIWTALYASALDSHLSGSYYKKIAQVPDTLDHFPSVSQDHYAAALLDPSFSQQKADEFSFLDKTGKARVISGLDGIFGDEIRFTDPKEYLEREHPLETVVGMIEFYSQSKSGALRNGGATLAGKFTNEAALLFDRTRPGSTEVIAMNPGSLVSSTGDLVVAHELMHSFLGIHTHDNPELKAAIEAINERLDDSYGPSILSYPQVVSNRMAKAEESYLRPLDHVIIELNRYATKKAIEHRKIPNGWREEYRERFREFTKVDFSSFLPTIDTGKRIALRSATNLATIELPIILLEELSCTVFGKELGNISPFASDILRMGLTMVFLGFRSSSIGLGITIGKCVLQSPKFKRMIADIAKETGFDETRLSQSFKTLSEQYSTLPTPLKSFINSFFHVWLMNSVSLTFANNTTFIPGIQEIYQYSCSAAENQATAALTGLSATALKMAVRAGFSKYRKSETTIPNNGATAPRIEEVVIDLETGGLESTAGAGSTDESRIEVVVESSQPSANITPIIENGRRTGFLYSPEEEEMGGSIWLGTKRRNNFRLMQENSIEYGVIKNIFKEIIFQAAEIAELPDADITKVIDYARKNGGISHKYDPSTKKYTKNTDDLPREWKIFSKIFQDMTKANDLLSCVAEKGIRLTFIPLSLQREIEDITRTKTSPSKSPKSPKVDGFRSYAHAV